LNPCGITATAAGGYHSQAQLQPQSLTLDPVSVMVASTPLDSGGQKFLVTDTLTDNKGNNLTFIQQTGHANPAVQVQSVQYNGGALTTPPSNQMQSEWRTDARGGIALLNQHVLLDGGAGTTQIDAHYDAAKNQTAIHVNLPTGSQDFTEPGMIVLQLSTINGNLSYAMAHTRGPNSSTPVDLTG